MIVVRVELKSAITGLTTELARMHICNVGGTQTKGDYECTTLFGRSKDELDKGRKQRNGRVVNYPRLSVHVWHLVARALMSMGYAGKAGHRRRSFQGVHDAETHPDIDSETCR